MSTVVDPATGNCEETSEGSRYNTVAAFLLGQASRAGRTLQGFDVVMLGAVLFGVLAASMSISEEIEGRTAVDALDLWLAPAVAADTPDDAAALATWFVDDLLGAVPQSAPWLTRAVEAFEKQLEVEQSAQDDPDADNAAGKLALARAIGMDVDGGDSSSEGGMTRLVSAGLERQMRRRYSPVHIAARTTQVDEILAQVIVARESAHAAADALARRLAQRLWWPPSLVARVVGAHRETAAVLAALASRLERSRAGFAALPEDDSLPGAAPAPVRLEPVSA